MALMGPSACGKTTLLNVLARRIAASNAKVSGATFVACLISYESDFAIATDKGTRLLPHRIDGSEPLWEDWKKLVQEILKSVNEEEIINA